MRKLLDEVVQMKQQRKRELVQLRHVRDQEAHIMQANFDSQVLMLFSLSLSTTVCNEFAFGSLTLIVGKFSETSAKLKVSYVVFFHCLET